MSKPQSRKATKGPSSHLTWAELACKDGTPYPAEWCSSRAIPLAVEFELIRRACGNRPIIVNSAYRTPEHNAAIGGKRRSQHPQGRAADLLAPIGLNLIEFHHRVCGCARQDDSRIRYVKLYSWGAHVDLRPIKRLVIRSHDWDVAWDPE